MIGKVVVWALLAGLGTFSLLVLWRGFFWQHALIIGIAIGALVFTTFRTVNNLRNLHKD